MTRTRTTPTPVVDLYEAAQLAGGLPRLVDTAVAALLERGRLRADGSGRLQAVGSTPGRPVESAVLDLVGPRPRRGIASVRLRAQEDPRLTGVAARLVADGLLRRNLLAVLGGDRPAHVCTVAGRQALAEWRERAPAGGAAAVALDGPAGLGDPVLRETVFGRDPGRRDAGAPAATSSSGGWAHAWWGGDSGGWGGDGGGGCDGGGGGCDGGGGGC